MSHDRCVSLLPRRTTARRRTCITGLAALAGLALSLTAGTVQAPTARAGSSPSGVPMPTGGDAKWGLVASDDFTGSTVSSSWGVHNGATGRHNWQAGQVSVANGVLTLRVSRDSSGQWAGAAMSYRLNQKYGKFLVRSRLDSGAGTRAVALLWPSAGWPPEIDFFEIGGSDPQRLTATQTLHYSAANKMIHTSYGCTCTNWHTFGVEWSPRKIVYTMDGKVMRSITSSVVPAQLMHLGLSASPGGAAAPSLATPKAVDYDIDWMAMFAYKG